MARLQPHYAFAAVALAGILASSSPAFSQARVQARRFVVPVASVVDQASRRSIGLVDVWASLGSLSQDNKRLSEENTDLKSQVDRLKEFELENARLREQLGIAPQINQQGAVIARVVGLAPSGFFQTIAIDRGSADGVSSGNPVVSSGHLVGIVADSAAHSATVRLVSAHNSLVPVVLGQSRAKGLLRGGVKGLVVEDIPVDTAITPGESILTAGLSESIPAGLTVGTVAEVISTKGDIFQTARVATPIKFNQLEIVAVIH